MASLLRRATAVAVIVFAGCIASAAPAARAPKTALPSRTPSITILRPKAGSTARGSMVTVAVAVKSFEVVNKQFQSPVKSEGHVHLYLDVKALPTTHEYPSPVHYHSISGTSYTWTGVSSGRHTFAVQLVGNDHVPLRPPATGRVTVTVR